MNNLPGKLVLGISAYFHDSAAVLVSGHEIIAAAQEERYSRKKADWQFPQNAINYCLEQLPSNQDLDAVSFYENPYIKLDRIANNAMIHAPRGISLWPKTLTTINTLNSTLPNSLLNICKDPEKIFFSEHHRSHAASAYYASPFSDAAILVVDGVGEWTTTSIWKGDGNDLYPLREIKFPHSLGLLYSAFTQYCGFKVNTGEYKLMGLAPFGKPVFKNLIYKHLIKVKVDGSFALNMDYFSFETTTNTITPNFTKLFHYPVRHPSEPISTYYMNIAASIQTVLSEIMGLLADSALRLSSSQNLCMAGGVALNCVTNSSIMQNTENLKNIWVQPAAGDAGGALGAALDVSIHLNPKDKNPKKKSSDSMQYAYLGPCFNAEQIAKEIQAHNLEYDSFIDKESNLIKEIVEALKQEMLIGYFDGRMEFGPRALGNRSILADPRPVNMLKRANNTIKLREYWRPLAPIVLAEHINEYFNINTPDPYMLFTTNILQKFHKTPSLKQMRENGLSELNQFIHKPTSIYPAVTHYDYSARVQTLYKHANPRLHRIMTRFHEQTDCPMLLNTSFNVRGEPIVCSPKDAIKAFLNTNLDILVIGDFIINRTKQKSNISNKIGKTKYRED